MCASLKPGVTSRPLRSTVRAPSYRVGYLARGADGDDACAVNGDGLGYLCRARPREDLAVSQDEAHAASAGLRAGAPRGKRGKRADGGEQQYDCKLSA